MTKEQEYRRNAAETLDLANRSATSADKGRLLRLAESWLDLADRAARLTHRFGPKQRPEFGPDHPLVRKAFDHLDSDPD
jgi:hypothetical protein